MAGNETDFSLEEFGKSVIADQVVVGVTLQAVLHLLIKLGLTKEELFEEIGRHAESIPSLFILRDESERGEAVALAKRKLKELTGYGD